MTVDVAADLERAMSDLREIDSDLALITGRGGGGSLSDRVNRKRPAPNFSSRISFDGAERRVEAVGDRRRITISVGNENSDSGRVIEAGGRLSKRIRFSDERRNSRMQDEYEDEEREPQVRRSIQSSVVMPPIETKSREVVLSEMKKKEKREDVVRNRNLFGRLLVGTLKQFQKEEKAIKPVETVQAQKQREVERRLELGKKEDMEKVRYEKEELLAKRREKEREIQKLKRVKAITQYADEKVEHYKRLQNYIQTQTKPPLFYLPAKHTLRTLELLKNSSKKIDSLIEKRLAQKDKELKKDEQGSDDDFDVPIRSKVIAPGENNKVAEEAASANIEDLEEPKLDEPMEEDEPEDKVVVKVRVESPKAVDEKVNGGKPDTAKATNGRGYSSDENDGVSAGQKRNSRDSRRSSRSSSSSSGSSGSASAKED